VLLAFGAADASDAVRAFYGLVRPVRAFGCGGELDRVSGARFGRHPEFEGTVPLR
jgi:hypothetical protein